MRGWELLVLGLLVSGCASPSTYQVSGAFTAERTDADLQELMALATEYGGKSVLMESFPEQFQIYGLAKDSCKTLLETLLEKSYVDSVGACVEQRAPTRY